MEGVRASVIPPAHLVQGHEPGQCGANLRGRTRLLEAHVGRLGEIFQPPPEVIAMLGAQAREIRFPGVAGQGNERTDTGRFFIRGPPVLLKFPRQARGCAGVSAKIGHFEHRHFAVQVVAQRLQRLCLPTTLDDQIQVIRGEPIGAEEFERAKWDQACEPPAPRRQGRNGDELAVGAQRDDTQLSVAGEMLPPGIQPLPGQEEGIRGTGFEQLVPLLPERAKAGRILDRLDHRRIGYESVLAGAHGSPATSGVTRCPSSATSAALKATATAPK